MSYLWKEIERIEIAFNSVQLPHQTAVQYRKSGGNASERGDIAFGIVDDIKSEYNDNLYEINLTETIGEHCYYKNICSLFEEANSDKVVMITDGCYSEEV